MKTIRLSDATYTAIASAAILPFHGSGQRQPDGSWIVQIADDTWDELERQRLPDESDDDTIQRVINDYFGRRNH